MQSEGSILVLGLAIHTELKAADRLTLSQLLSVFKRESQSCYAVSVKVKYATPTF